MSNAAIATTASTRDEPLLERHPGNPILTADEWPYRCGAVFNPGAVRLKDGTTVLLCRVEDRRGHSHLTVARSRDGLTNWQVDPEPTLPADPANHPEEWWGIEDPRVVYVEELDKYVVTYTSYSRDGPCVSLATTEDFRTFDRVGSILGPTDKNAALFPRRIGDQWAILHRPMTREGSHIWVSQSRDLENWGHHRIVMESRKGPWWDATKVGISPPPIETDDGWLLLYHGVKETCFGYLYRMGAALLDAEDPTKVLRRGDEWILAPDAPYERYGDVGNVVFPCGATVGDDGDTLTVYYGGADTTVAAARGSLRRIVDWLHDAGSVPEAQVDTR